MVCAHIHAHRVTQTHSADVKVELEANEIQLILITFEEERRLPPSVEDNSLFYLKLFFYLTLSFILVLAQSVSNIYRGVDNALC